MFSVLKCILCFFLICSQLQRVFSFLLNKWTSKAIFHRNKLNSIDNFFADSLEEVNFPISLEVRGKIPSYVNGTLIKNGPGLFGSLSKRRYDRKYLGLLYK